MRKMSANYWQGLFPWQILVLDSYVPTVLVGSCHSNGYRPVEMIGDFLERMERTTGWFAVRHKLDNPSCSAEINPRSGREGNVDPQAPRAEILRRLLEGGSLARVAIN
jgi:hypothetical protein